MTFPECKFCYGHTEVPCEHRINYMISESFIKGQQINGVNISIVEVTDEPTEKYWKAGKCDMEGGPTIRLWPSAYTLYGWDMMSAVLIHEFGHLKLFAAENIYKGLEAEDKANSYGFCYMRRDLVPRHYWHYREFFLPSHLHSDGWDEAKCRAEYATWIMWMQGSPMVRALSSPSEN